MATDMMEFFRSNNWRGAQPGMGNSSKLALLTRLAGGMGAWRGDAKIEKERRGRMQKQPSRLEKEAKAAEEKEAEKAAVAEKAAAKGAMPTGAPSKWKGLRAKVTGSAGKLSLASISETAMEEAKTEGDATIPEGDATLPVGGATIAAEEGRESGVPGFEIVEVKLNREGRHKLGLVLDDDNSVVMLRAGGPAALSGEINVGDEITEIEGVAVSRERSVAMLLQELPITPEYSLKIKRSQSTVAASKWSRLPSGVRAKLSGKAGKLTARSLASIAELVGETKAEMEPTGSGPGALCESQPMLTWTAASRPPGNNGGDGSGGSSSGPIPAAAGLPAPSVTVGATTSVRPRLPLLDALPSFSPPVSHRRGFVTVISARVVGMSERTSERMSERVSDRALVTETPTEVAALCDREAGKITPGGRVVEQAGSWGSSSSERGERHTPSQFFVLHAKNESWLSRVREASAAELFERVSSARISARIEERPVSLEQPASFERPVSLAAETATPATHASEARVHAAEQPRDVLVPASSAKAPPSVVPAPPSVVSPNGVVTPPNDVPMATTEAVAPPSKRKGFSTGVGAKLQQTASTPQQAAALQLVGAQQQAARPQELNSAATGQTPAAAKGTAKEAVTSRSALRLDAKDAVSEAAASSRNASAKSRRSEAPKEAVSESAATTNRGKRPRKKTTSS